MICLEIKQGKEPGEDLAWNLSRRGFKLESNQERIYLEIKQGKDLTWNQTKRGSNFESNQKRI